MRDDLDSLGSSHPKLPQNPQTYWHLLTSFDIYWPIMTSYDLFKSCKIDSLHWSPFGSLMTFGLTSVMPGSCSDFAAGSSRWWSLTRKMKISTFPRGWYLANLAKQFQWAVSYRWPPSSLAQNAWIIWIWQKKYALTKSTVSHDYHWSKPDLDTLSRERFNCPSRLGGESNRFTIVHHCQHLPRPNHKHLPDANPSKSQIQTVNRRSYSFCGNISIDAGVNWVIDQWSAVEYLYNKFFTSLIREHGELLCRNLNKNRA